MNITAIEKAVQIAGGQTALARLIGVRQGQIWKYMQSKRVPGERVLDIERETGVSRHDLRPDIFGPDPDRSARQPSPHPTEHREATA